MSLDLAVARTLHIVTVLERALHSAGRPGDWTIAVEGLHLSTVREVTNDAIVFTTHAPDVIFSGPMMVGLYFRGELQDCLQIQDPREIVWELALHSVVAA